MILVITFFKAHNLRFLVTLNRIPQCEHKRVEVRWRSCKARKTKDPKHIVAEDLARLRVYHIELEKVDVIVAFV